MWRGDGEDALLLILLAEQVGVGVAATLTHFHLVLEFARKLNGVHTSIQDIV